MKRASWFSTIAAALVASILIVSPAGAALSAPVVTAPADSGSGEALPVFAWQPVAGAARYEWEIAADPGFNSPVLGSNWDHFFTRNTRATMWKVVPNGTYWWHVRAVTADGSVSPWSQARQYTKRWARSPDLLFPANRATVVFPEDHFRLAWESVPGAVKYLVSIATDPSLGSLVWSGNPITTQATAFTLAKPLAPDQTYYWGITPLDAAGNRGSASLVRSFRWVWPSTTTPRVADVAPEPEIYDHEFSWDRVPGAAGYEIEVNTSSDFAPGSRVCCTVDGITGLTTIGTSYTPAIVLPNNRYYWRVRAVDAAKNTGVWNEGPTFVKSFDNALPSIQNLHLTLAPTPATWPVETSTPAIEWDPVPGASSYEVEVTVHTDDGCQWTSRDEHWKSATATPAWTPLGWSWNSVKPYESPRAVAWDLPQMRAGHEYCVRVTALDRPSNFLDPYVRSAETYLPAENQPAFLWLGADPGAPCTSPCNAGSLGAGDYLTPIGGVVERDMPLLRWNPIEGYESYFVLVSRDEGFTNLVDYAFTRVPAYAPRLGYGPRTYPDETTQYYWAVLPARNGDGSGVTTAPRFSAPQSFHKQSIPPELMAPADGTLFSGPAHFQWRPVIAARRYRLQVSTDPSFASCPALAESTVPSCPENTVADSTAFTSKETYRADVNLYWRVRADAETVEDANGVGLTWSRTGTFRKTLPAPVPDADNPTAGDAVPTWEWDPVAGAVSYDFELRFPDGNFANFTGIPSAAATATVLKGTGIWTWRVRARFPQVNKTATTEGPWSPPQLFTRTIRQPANPAEDVTPTHVVLSWDPKPNAFNYRVQVSTRADFTGVFDSQKTDNTSWAPFLAALPYSTGGTYYWRVAAADDEFLNVGDYTAARAFTLPATVSKTASRITASVTKTARLVKVSGYVFPAHPAKRVTVTLYRKRSGVFRALSTKRPLLNSLSRYATSFSRPRRGACKVTARFGGDADHRASAKSVSFRC